MRLALAERFKPGFGTEKTKRIMAVVFLGLIVVSAGALAVRDIELRSETEHAAKSEAIRELSNLANMLFLADAAHVDSLVARLRIELRAQDLWADSGTVDALGLSGDGRNEIDARRLHGILRRSLMANEDVRALELVVAGHDGLSTFRLDQGAASEPREVLDPRVQEGFAKALWYSDEVRRSVVSSGRRVERGDLTLEQLGDAEHPILRVAIGLHEPGELVQGAIVALIDVGVFARRLETASTADGRIALLMADGRALSSQSVVIEVESRNAALAARVLGAAELPEVFSADGRLIYGLPMAHADGTRANLLVLVEATAPAFGLAAWLATPWPLALTLLALTLAVALWALWAFGGGVAPLEQTKVTPKTSADVADSGAASEIEIASEAFALRDWLSDVRGCLERDAATRGLALEMRCERSLPSELKSDPGWLGGLLVAIGREALDATSGEGVRLDVMEDAGDTLRFELEANGLAFSPVHGMQEVAEKMDGHFDTSGEGRVALILQNALVSADPSS